MNEELLRKSLTDKGLTEEQISEVLASSKVEPEVVTEEGLQKSLSDTAALLKAAAAGNVPEEELNERIQKAIDGVTDKYEQHAKTIGAVTDTYVAAHKAEMVEIRKAVSDQNTVLGKLTTVLFDIKKALDAQPAPEKVDVKAIVAEATESISKALVPQGKAVTTDNASQVVPHPGDTKPEDIKKGLTAADAHKILNKHPDRLIADRARWDLNANATMAPADVLAKHRIPVPAQG